MKFPVQALQKEYLTDITQYESEINLYLSAWLQSVKNCLQKGLVLLIDYGFPAHEYYHRQRAMGTLMCHYRQHAHADPFYLPGIQDITAHVDFTAVAEAAFDAGFHVAGYNTQADFLLACGLLTFANINAESDIQQRVKMNHEIHVLTAPQEMGELFKVIALTCGLDTISLLGFAIHDKRFRL